MQGKRLVIFLVISATLFASWVLINNYLQKKHPEWYVEPKPEQTASQNQSSPSGTQPTTQIATTQPGAIYAIGGQPRCV